MNKTEKKYLYYLIFFLIGVFLIFQLIGYLRVKFAKIEIVLVDDLTIEFQDKKHISDFIASINGKIVDDYEIPTTEVGKQDLVFHFINDDGIRLQYTFQIEVVDTVAPLIFLGNRYRLPVHSEVDLRDAIFCGDNYDNRPDCSVVGEYDVDTVGNYPLEFVAKDASGNKTNQKFTLEIYEPIPSSNSRPVERTYTNFKDVVKHYKTNETKIGLDISYHQGDIDFDQIKSAGVEFLMIRLGGTRGTNGEYFVDSKFEEYMKKAKEVDLPVGVYFYSYSNSIEAAKKDAQWVTRQLKDYDLELPVAFDWEEWGNFNSYHLSFFGLTSMAEAFLEEIEAAGYEGMLYSSKNYLENVWNDSKYQTWLAHYTKKTNYKGPYSMWQMCENGKIDGIKDVVDIDILYR